MATPWATPLTRVEPGAGCPAWMKAGVGSSPGGHDSFLVNSCGWWLQKDSECWMPP